MSRKISSLAKPFQGRWRITSMELWDKAAIDLVEPGFLEFKSDNGAMSLIVVEAWLDGRYATRDGEPFAEFSWEGMDEGDQRCGRGWTKVAKDRTLEGRILFHQGDDSGFTCSPW
tara:strand:- start:54 stop:398 length:345 start_codon:yes stop_codon:yes gene_type:complete